MENEILSHIKPRKLLTNHLKNVKDIADLQVHKYIYWENFDKILSTVSYLHDIGKFTSFFQKYLKFNEYSRYKQHSRLGAYATYFSLLASEVPLDYAILASEAVMRHHQALKNLNDNFFIKWDFLNDRDKKEEKETIRYLLNKQIADIKKRNIQPEIQNYISKIKYPDKKEVIEIKKKIKKIVEAQDPQYYFFLNYLFSLLIEADKLDASNTPIYRLKPINVDLVDKHIMNFKPPENERILKLNKIRNEVRKSVIFNINEPEFGKYKIYTLTAPTGIGKTLTAIDFAIKLRDKLYKEKGYIPQIIYALPFVNIIEQTFYIVQKVVGDNYRVLAHYHLTDIFEKEFPDDKDEWDDIDKYHKNLMRLETWQADFVITSFVQFFQTLITNQNKLLKKFNHYAGAIVILDEVQSLPSKYLPLVGAMLHLLTKYLDTYILLMTATQPKIFELAQNELYNHRGFENLKITKNIPTKELLSNNRKYFKLFNRTYIEPHLDKEMNSEEFRSFFFDKWNKNNSALIVCNTINRSIEIFKLLNTKINKKVNPIYYLSTNITPYEKQARIEQIKKDIKSGKKPILVSTQVVEAGVDLDFDMAVRDIGPIDAIIQVAGRVNRNNKSSLPMPVYIVKLGNDKKLDGSYVYHNLTIEIAETTLKNFPKIEEKNYKELIEKFFDEISNRKSFDISIDYFEVILKLDYDKVSRFHLIDEKEYEQTVFVELNDEATQVKVAYQKLLSGEIKKAEFDKKWRRIFNSYLISVNKIYTDNGLIRLDDRIKLIPKYLLDTYYDTETGFKRKLDGQATIL